MVTAKATPGIVSLMIAGALLALAGCATTQGQLTSSADHLERSAGAFASDARYASNSEFGNTDLAGDARALADRAADFRHTVNDDRADRTEVRHAFERVSSSYHALRQDVDRSQSSQARADLRPVTQAYLDVEANMQGRPTPDRFAERGYGTVR